MKNILKKALAYISAALMLVSLPATAQAAASPAGIEFDLRIGSTSMQAYGEKSVIEAPYRSGGVVFVPLRPVFEALGAEITWQGNNRIRIQYRDIDAEITVGSTKYTVNKAAKSLKSSPRTVHQSTMIPLQFLTDNYDIQASVDSKTGNIRIILKDDGALKDLSFLTDGVGKPRVGNSYFGWNISVPGGTVIKNVSFNSRYVLLENEQRNLDIEVSVSPNKDNKKFPDYYDELLKKQDEFGFKPITESSMQTSGERKYAEFLYSNVNDEAALRRVYIENGKIYNVIFTAYDQTNANKIKENTFYMGLLNSFTLGYEGSSSDVQDISNIKDGRAAYMNYVTYDSGNKYYTWSMNVLPEWDILTAGVSDIQETKLGSGTGEYFDITFQKADASKNAEKYATEAREKYDRLINPSLYTFIDGKKADIAGTAGYVLTYALKINGKDYMFEEYFFLQDKVMYNIILKSPKGSYDSRKDSYHKMLDSLKLQKLDMVTLLQDMDYQDANDSDIAIGKGDQPALYQNRTYKWSVKLPGYWTRNNNASDALTMFDRPDTDITISVESVENKSSNKQVIDTEKFSTMGLLIKKYEMKAKGTGTVTLKDTTVRTYTYRLESDDYESYADVLYRVVDNGKYSYCYMTILSDLYMTDTMKKELDGIWSTFDFEPQQAQQ